MEMEDVLVASTACGAQTSASRAKMSNLSCGISGTASITKSTLESASVEVAGESRARAASASSCVMRCFATCLDKRVSFIFGGRRQYFLLAVSLPSFLSIFFSIPASLIHMDSLTCKPQSLVQGGL